MSIVEATLRGSAVAILLLLAVFYLRDARSLPSGRNRALFLLSAAAYTVCSAPDFARNDLPFGFPLLIVSLGVPALLWISAAAVFDDNFEPSRRRGIAWVGLVILGLWSVLDRQPVAAMAYYGTSLLFIGLAARHALAGWRTELIDAQCQMRSPIAIAGTLYAATITIADFVSPGSTVAAPLSLVNSIGLAIITFSSAVCGLQMALKPRPAVPAKLGGHRSGMTSQRYPMPIAFEKQETLLSEALQELMDVQKLYRHHGLGIGDVGARLGVPEYRLRRLINRQLGHRNFSSFINGYRLTEARRALEDPTQAEVPILTIALDAGFQSLAPFNRAFKAATGTTPSDYRKRCLSRTNGEPQ